MGAATPSNSLSWVSNTGYLTHPQARSCAWGNTEADGASTVRCTSKEPADPRHPITTHTPVPFTRHRPGQTNRNPEACATEATETSSRAVPAPPDAKAKHEGQIEEVGGHPSRRDRGEPTATLALRLTCCTREASARPCHGAQSAPLRGPHTMPSRAKPQSPHVCTGCLRQARQGMGIGPRINRRCPSTKASNHARGMPRQLPSAGAIKAKNAVPVA